MYTYIYKYVSISIYKYVSISIYKNTHAYLLLDILTYIYMTYLWLFLYTALIPKYTINNHLIIAICMSMLYP